ncbi:sugar phosphate isomerase/epimerase [Paenibacillus psychroresistens]|uniref:Sugar phosphate isomerase/epimerase n=1 Tax=Paenibacillus psychroresistens TaxID=1778678 RepID=A0A6B8RDR6_9BACL|nr:TIM barrel protein [Paenibacillus psychroresistens]QGQ94581.1 sugar phosphate isomerase/epimerase [Paenibacillus psychroresistens]
MRLGGPIFVDTKDPIEWVKAHKAAGYTAAYSPALDIRDEKLIQAYKKEAEKADLLIAEVGAWSNPIDLDDDKRLKAINYCQERLEYAEMLGAKCCVNIAGARGEIWNEAYAANLSEDTFALIVDTIRSIVDAVKPQHTFYTLETMQWVFPDSVESYVRLIKAIDRKSFAVHLDPVNLIVSPRSYFQNAALLTECFTELGPYIKSCHAKDIKLTTHSSFHLDEVIPGSGALDYQVFLKQLNGLHRDTPLMLEHLSSEAEYIKAANYIRSVAEKAGIQMEESK